ncbi:uncharacterized protein K02A2.6-like [Takifugu rubripes]|uniref:uncharacterized protein K02A2.6-like n=1 Tax=Takifugu rubripes TaxID=31033 RepID=UPI001145E3D6|nr:uncharacterized protein K02A2.6-like [Takifugu rubripes]
MCDEAHGPSHVWVDAIKRLCVNMWHPDLHKMIEQIRMKCDICNQFNPKSTFRNEQGAFPVRAPGAEIIMDFTDMGDRAMGKHYLLVIVDTCSGWPEAYPTAKEDVAAVKKALVNHFIPTHGFPRTIRSNNGSHFKNKHLREVETAMGIKHKFGTVYHPQSQGKVERMNSNIKTKLAKIMKETGLNWVEALLLALMTIRHTVNRATGFTPFVLHHGRPFPRPGHPMTEGAVVHPKVMFKLLNYMCSSFSLQIPPEPQERPDLTGEEYLLLKVLKRKWQEPRWTGPHRVTARTDTAIWFEGRGDTWFHLSQCAKVPKTADVKGSSYGSATSEAPNAQQMKW